METITKTCECPEVSICSNSDNTGLVISATLPGVHKEDIKLEMTSETLCLSGERDEVIYDSCYELPCAVNEKKSDARYDNGLLTVTVPYKEVSRGKKITIH